MQIRPRSRFQPRLVRAPELWSLAVVVLPILVAAEVVGRRAGSDLADALVLILLACVGATFGVLHSVHPIPWVSAGLAGLRRLRRRIAARTFELGVDLRGEPPLPAAVPRLILWPIAGLSALLAIAAAWMASVHVAFRPLATRVFYLGYVTALGVLWAALVAAIGLMVYLPAAHIHDLFVSRWNGSGRRPHWPEISTLAAYFLAALAGGLFLPLWIPAASIGAGLVVSVAYTWLPPRRTLNLLWRERRSREIRSFGWSTYLTIVHVLLFLPFLLVVLLSIGREAIGLAPVPSAMPITATLGRVAAWLAAVGLPFLAGYFAYHGYRMRRHDPERPCPTVVHVAGADRPEDRRRLRELLASRGWRVRFHPAAPARTDVRVRLVAPPMPRPFDRPHGQPLEVSLDALQVPELLDVIARRDEIQRRRILVRTLRSIFRRAARRRYRSGSGYWVAPHYWFISALSRDTYDESFDADEGTLVLGVIPPFYHRALPRAVRHTLHRMCRCLAVDLIFLEDGVGFRGLRKVLRTMFEHYDIHGGRRRIEEMNFRGLQGIRVVIHDYQLDRPLNRKSYPEPDYEDLGRARVLHVFRDRGGPVEDDFGPLDIDRLLMPAGSRG